MNPFRKPVGNQQMALWESKDSLLLLKMPFIFKLFFVVSQVDAKYYQLKHSVYSLVTSALTYICMYIPLYIPQNRQYIDSKDQTDQTKTSLILSVCCGTSLYTSPCRKVRVLGTSHPQSIDTCGSQNTYLPSLIIRSIFVTGRKVASCLLMQEFPFQTINRAGHLQLHGRTDQKLLQILTPQGQSKGDKGANNPLFQGLPSSFCVGKETMSVYDIYSQKEASQKYIHEYHLIFVYKTHNVKMCIVINRIKRNATSNTSLNKSFPNRRGTIPRAGLVATHYCLVDHLCDRTCHLFHHLCLSRWVTHWGPWTPKKTLKSAGFFNFHPWKYQGETTTKKMWVVGY